MTAIVAIICLTLLALACVLGAFLERHRRFWVDRDCDALKRSADDARTAAARAEAATLDARKKLEELETQLTFMRGRG